MEFMIILSSFIAILLPGYALTLLLPRGKYLLGERLIIALGMVFVYIPLLTLYCTYIGIEFSKLFITILIILSGIITIGYHLKNKEKLNIDRYCILLVLILILSLFVRLAPVQNFIVPPNNDGYTHTIVTKLISEKGGIPDSYYPYESYTTFIYHFGFHSVVSAVHSLSGIEITRLVTIIGQFVNAFILLSVFLFARRLTKNKDVALISALIVGLISPFPAYLINWGRFTQLSGLFMLPIILVLIIDSIQSEKVNFPLFFLSIISLAGLFLTHTRVFFMGEVFIFSFLVINRKLSLWMRMMIIFILGMGIISPWLLNIFQTAKGNIIFKEWTTLRFQLSILSGVSQAECFSLKRLGESLYFYSTKWLLFLGIIGIIVGIWKRDKLTFVFLLWLILLFIWSNPYWVLTFFSGFVDINSLVISLYFPISILGALFIIHLINQVKKKDIILACIIVVVSLLSFKPIFRIVEPERVYVQKDDCAAMDWISKNISKNAKFLISFYSLGSFTETGSVVGTDAGYWIPFFTGRRTTIPLMVHDFEKPDEKDIWKSTTQIVKMVSGNPSSNETIRLLQENNVTHLYVGKRSSWQPVEKSNFYESRFYEPVFHQGKTWIFKINYEELHN